MLNTAQILALRHHTAAARRAPSHSLHAEILLHCIIIPMTSMNIPFLCVHVKLPQAADELLLRLQSVWRAATSPIHGSLDNTVPRLCYISFRAHPTSVHFHSYTSFISMVTLHVSMVTLHLFQWIPSIRFLCCTLLHYGYTTLVSVVTLHQFPRLYFIHCFCYATFVFSISCHGYAALKSVVTLQPFPQLRWRLIHMCGYPTPFPWLRCMHFHGYTSLISGREPSGPSRARDRFFDH